VRTAGSFVFKLGEVGIIKEASFLTTVGLRIAGSFVFKLGEVGRIKEASFLTTVGLRILGAGFVAVLIVALHKDRTSFMFSRLSFLSVALMLATFFFAKLLCEKRKRNI